MSFTSYAFKDNIVINDSKWIRWLNSTGTTRANILGVDSNNVYLNSGTENLYINSNTDSYTFINDNNSNNVLIGSKLAVGINTTENLNLNLAIASGGYIGTNTNDGFIGLSGSYSTSHTESSLIRLYGNESIHPGQVHFLAGNNTAGHLNFYTGDNSLKMQIMNSGMTNLSPNGNDVRMSVSDSETIISNITKITSTEPSTDISSGALQVHGGMSITKSLYVGESIISGNIVYGTISYGNLYANTFNIGLAKTISSTFDADNNIASPTNITGLLFDPTNIRSFSGSISIAVQRSSGGNLYENLSIEGHYTESEGWRLFTSSVGDLTGISITISSIGQIRYTSLNTANWLNTKIRYVITYISNTSNYEGINITTGTFVANILNINDTRNAFYNTEYGSFYNPGGGTFDKNLVVKGNLIAVNSTNTIGSIITTDGNVGIGTTSPSQKLDVNGTVNANNYRGTNITVATLNLTTGITAGTANLTNVTSTNITSATINLTTGITAGTANLTNVTSTNITSATINLTTGITAGTANLTNVNSTNITTSILNVSTGITAGNINFTGDLYKNGNLYISSQWKDGTSGSLFYTSGNVGIGTTAPQYKLDVSGDINFEGLLYKNGSLYISSQWTQETSGSLFYTKGNIGIGTTNPMVSLDVVGDIKSSGSITVGSMNVTGKSILNGVTVGNFIVSSSFSISDTANAPLDSLEESSVYFTEGGLSYKRSLGSPGSWSGTPYNYTSEYFITALPIGSNPDPQNTANSPSAFKYIGSTSQTVNWRLETSNVFLMFPFTLYIDILDIDGSTIKSTPVALNYSTGSIPSGSGIQTTVLNPNEYIRFRVDSFYAYIDNFVFTYNLSASYTNLIVNSSGVTSGNMNSSNITVGSINVTGQSILNGTVTSGFLFVDGGNDPYIKEAYSVTTGALTVNGGAGFTNDVYASSFRAIMDVNAPFVYGNVKLYAGNLEASAGTILNQYVTAGSLAVTGASLLFLGVTAGSLNVTGHSILNGTVTTGALAVTGASLLFLGVTAGSLNVTGHSILNGTVTTGALAVTGESLLFKGVTTGSLNVTGQSSLHGSVTAGALAVAGASILRLGATVGSINVTGDSIFQSAVTAGSLNVINQTILNKGITAGSLNVTGSTILNGVTVASINIINDINFNGNLYKNNQLFTSSQWSTSGSFNLFYTSGNVGIITTNPQYTLDVTGDINFTGSIYQNGTLFSSGGGGGGSGTSYWNAIGNNIFYTKGNVGIGTTAPTVKLDVSGSIKCTTITAGNLFSNSINTGISRIYSASFTAGNNVSSSTNITNLVFDSVNTGSFNINLGIVIVRSSGGNLYEYITLEGYYTGSGWTLFTTNTGDDCGIVFSITSGGQIQYTSNDQENWTSTTFRYFVNQLSNAQYELTPINIGGGGDLLWDSSGSTIFYTAGNVGIGTTSPSVNLDVSGNMKCTTVTAGNLFSNSINTGISRIYSATFTAGNNVSTPTDVTGLVFDNTNTGSFTIDMSVSLTKSIGGNLYEYIKLEGCYTETGWDLYAKSLGNITDIIFSISNSGQVQYTSTDQPNWTSTTFRYSVNQLFNTLYELTPGNFGTGAGWESSGNDIYYTAGNVSFSNFSSGTGTIGGHLIPSTDVTYDLGSSTKKWRDLYLSGSTINLGDQTISVNTAGNLQFSSNKLVIGGETLIATNGSILLGESSISTTFGNAVSMLQGFNELSYNQQSDNGLNVFKIYDLQSIYYDGWINDNNTNLLFTGSDFGSMTSNSCILNDKLYIASESSQSYGSEAHFVFNLNSSNGWVSAETYNSETGVYTGSVSTTAGSTVYSGEWIQIQYPEPFLLTNFTIIRAPRSFVVVGSNNGSTWNLLHEETNHINPPGPPIKTTFNTPSVTESYSYYRLIGLITADQYETQISLPEWELNPTYSAKTYKFKVSGTIENIYSNITQNKNFLIKLLDGNNDLIQTIYTSSNIPFVENEYMTPYVFDTGFIEITPSPGNKIQLYMDGTDLNDTFQGLTGTTIELKKQRNITVFPITDITGYLSAPNNSSTIGSLIATGGNIGIGTTAPSSKLDISGNLRITGGSLLATHNSNTIGSLYTTGGNVGINTTTPRSQLDINGDIFTNTLTIDDKNADGIVLTEPGYITRRFESNTFGSAVIFASGSNYWDYASNPYLRSAIQDNLDTDYFTLGSNPTSFIYQKTFDKISIRLQGSYFSYTDAYNAGATLSLRLVDNSNNLIQTLITLNPPGPSQSANFDTGFIAINNMQQNYKIVAYTTFNQVSSGGYTIAYSNLEIKEPIMQNQKLISLNNGNVGIGMTAPGYKLHVDGDIYAVGKVVAFSDERLKTDILPIQNPMAKVSSLRGVEYKMLNSDEKNIGVIAQEVEKVCPEFVVSKENNYKGVCYGNMVGLLIEAIKELNEKIEKLENEKAQN